MPKVRYWTKMFNYIYRASVVRVEGDLILRSRATCTKIRDFCNIVVKRGRAKLIVRSKAWCE